MEHHFQHCFLAFVKRMLIFGRSPRKYIILGFGITTTSGKLEGIEEFDIDTIMLHDALNRFSLHSNNAFVVLLRNIPIQFGWEFFQELFIPFQNLLQLRSHDINQEVVLCITFERNVAVCCFHYFVDLATFLSCYKLLQLVCHFATDANAVWILRVELKLSFEEEIE